MTPSSALRQSVSVIIAFIMLLGHPMTLMAQSGGNCSVFRTWNTGDSVTAGDLNSSFSTVGVTNMTQACIDGISDSIANMQATVSPWTGDAESLATSGTGELQRLRYVIENFFGLANWYRIDSNINFASGSAIDGSGLGRHVTAVGYHSWSGSLRWPAITSVAAHTSGIFWPFEHHLVIAFDATSDSGRFGSGQTNARSWYAFHAQAMTFHHTAALRFAMPSSDGQPKHLTALRVAGGSPDRLVVGHAGATLAVEGSGISGGSNQLLAVAASGALSTTPSTSVGLWGSRGQFSGTGGTTNAGHVFTLRAHVVQLITASSHALTVRMAPAAINVDISDNTGSANGGVNEASPNGRDRKATLDANTWIHFYWIWHSGSSLLRGIASPNDTMAGPNLPAGFDAWAYAGAVRRSTVEATPLIPTHILGAISYYHTGASVVNTATPGTSENTVDVSAQVPPNAVSYLLNASWLTSTAGDIFAIRYISGNRDHWVRDSTGLTAGFASMMGDPEIPNLSQRFFYQVTRNFATRIEVRGYRNPNGG